MQYITFVLTYIYLSKESEFRIVRRLRNEVKLRLEISAAKYIAKRFPQLVVYT